MSSRQTWRRLFALVLIGAVLFFVAAWMLGSRQAAPVNQPVAAAQLPAVDVALRAADGSTVAGTYWPGRVANAPAVLLLHGNDASREAMRPAAEWLAGEGYAVLTIDFRGHGESAAVDRSFGWFEALDARAAFTWLKARQGGAKVAIVGSSLGGAASLMGEGGPIAADAMVLQAVYPDIRHAIRNRVATRLGSWAAVLIEPALSYQSRLRFGIWPADLAPINGLRRYRGPTLVIGSQADSYTPPEETRAMAAAAGGPAELWLVDGADHAALIAAGDAQWRSRVAAFLSRHLPTDDGAPATTR